MNEKQEKQSKIKDGNFYVVQSFMVKDLKLKGLELSCYAIIYGFSQDDEQWFTGSLQYLSDWTCSSKQAVMTALKKLVDKGLLEKKDNYVNGVKFVAYNAIYETGGQENLGGSQETCIPPSKKVDSPMQETCPNSLDDNLFDNIGFDKEKDIPDKEDKRLSPDFPSERKEIEIESPNALASELVKAGYIEGNDVQMEEYNRFLEDIVSKYDFKVIRSCVWYFVQQFKIRQGLDESGQPIGSRFHYFKASVEHGAWRITSDPCTPERFSEDARRIAESWGL